MAKARPRGSSGSRSSSSLRRYLKKRDLSHSGEPEGGSSTHEGASYVIQKHDATRLHYDFRLEMAGVLKSWAVPKGVPAAPSQKALAIEVEDHPLDYGSFEGVIPAGNYGAGAVMVWDRGKYIVHGSSALAAYRSGKIHFTLAGEKCQGEWTLVRLHSREKDKIHWLLIKNHDSAKGTPIRRMGRDLSVLSNRSLEQIAGSIETPKKAHTRRSKATPAKGRFPKFVEPMKAYAVEAIPAGDWLLEIKYDGYRALAACQGKRVELWSRTQNDLTNDYPEITEALCDLPCHSALIDGEIAALDKRGRPSFQLLQNRETSAERPPILYYAFDLIQLNGRDLRDDPIEQRREALAKLIKPSAVAIRLSPAFDVSPAALLKKVRTEGLEGIVAKAMGSAYEPGLRSGAWLKCRLVNDQEFVIGGFTPPQRSRKCFGALLVGYYQKGRLMYVGKVGTGFDDKQLSSLLKRFLTLRVTACPFANLPLPRRPRYGTGMTASAMREVTWLRPSLVCQVHFREWTRDGLLRQPAFLGLRADKPAREVVREVSSN